MRNGPENLTESDIQKIEAEIEERKLKIRPQLIAEVAEARAQGDLSENFEYYAAKRAKNKNESRIGYLERMLKTARVVTDQSAEDEVGMNNHVEVEFMDTHEIECYKIVTSIRGDSLRNLISIESPIGKALIRHKVGDVCKVKVNDSYSYEIKILKIDKTTDDSEDTIKSF